MKIQKYLPIVAIVISVIAVVLVLMFKPSAPEVQASIKVFVPSSITVEGNAAALAYWPRLAGREPLAQVNCTGTASAAHIFVLVNGEVAAQYTVPVPSSTYVYVNLTKYVTESGSLKIEIKVVGV